MVIQKSHWNLFSCSPETGLPVTVDFPRRKSTYPIFASKSSEGSPGKAPSLSYKLTPSPRTRKIPHRPRSRGDRALLVSKQSLAAVNDFLPRQGPSASWIPRVCTRGPSSLPTLPLILLPPYVQAAHQEPCHPLLVDPQKKEGPRLALCDKIPV